MFTTIGDIKGKSYFKGRQTHQSINMSLINVNYKTHLSRAFLFNYNSKILKLNVIPLNKYKLTIY